MEYRKYGTKIVIRMDPGDEIAETVTEVCRREKVPAATVQGIGFTDEIQLRVYDKEHNTFLFPIAKGDMEITSLTGNVVQTEHGPFAHLHIMAADAQTYVRGGHLIRCVIAATGEIVLELLEGEVHRGPSNDEKLGTLLF